jgi:hypothetical protein
MSRFPRLRRRPDHWADAHARARARAAERLDGPLGLAESTWLDGHLAECEDCAAITAAYAADRAALRALRDDQPEPPRDLWARTAAAIEILSNEAGIPDEGHLPESSRAGRNGLPLGAMSAFAVVVVVVGATLLSNGLGFFRGQTAMTDNGLAAPSVAAASLAPEGGAGAEPTPFAVDAADVAWIDSGKDHAALKRASVNEVCHAEGASDCPALREQGEAEVAFESAPRTIIGSPTTEQAVAIAKTGEAGDEVIVVELPKPDGSPSASPNPAASIEPSTSPRAAASESPSETAGPSPSVTISTSPSAQPLESVEPTQAARLAIASGIQVVGESAAFSSDGSWFAFTAKAAEADAGGSDVFVWRVGDRRAERLTTDGHSYFASWSGDRVVVSRPSDASATRTDPVSVLIDPSTGDERAVGSLWRPMVDPSGRFAIAWDGTIERTEAADVWAPGRGRLELRPWSSESGPAPSKGSGEQVLVTDAARGDFDVRWDDTGEWVAVWVGDERNAPTGRLSLYRVDNDGGRLEKVKGAPEDVQALPGFSIGSGRLAWATPRGQGGEGSRVQIAAWSGGGIGTVETDPGEDVRLIR